MAVSFLVESILRGPTSSAKLKRMSSVHIENDFDIPTALEVDNFMDQLQVELLTFYTEINFMYKMIACLSLSIHEEKCSRSGSMFLSLACMEFQFYYRLYAI